MPICICCTQWAPRHSLVCVLAYIPSHDDHTTTRLNVVVDNKRLSEAPFPLRLDAKFIVRSVSNPANQNAYEPIFWLKYPVALCSIPPAFGAQHFITNTILPICWLNWREIFLSEMLWMIICSSKFYFCIVGIESRNLYKYVAFNIVVDDPCFVCSSCLLPFAAIFVFTQECTVFCSVTRRAMVIKLPNTVLPSPKYYKFVSFVYVRVNFRCIYYVFLSWLAWWYTCPNRGQLCWLQVWVDKDKKTHQRIGK